jgi:hypothetical protein
VFVDKIENAVRELHTRDEAVPLGVVVFMEGRVVARSRLYVRRSCT